MQIHPLYCDPRTRAELHAVLGSAFTTLLPKIDAARALGWDWDAVTTPFVDRLDDRIVAHVGVLEVPLRLDGREGPVRLAFTPDRFPDAEAVASGPAGHGHYMVRGPFPLEPHTFAVPPLCQH